MWILWLIVIILCLILLGQWVKHEQFDKIPGPPGLYILENAFDFFLMDSVRLFYHFRKLTSIYKQLLKIKLGPMKILVIYNPEDVEALISGTKYNKKGFVYTFIKPWLQEGLLLSDGAKWQQRRKILTPAFHFNILRNFNYILQENCWKFVEGLRHEENKDKTEVSSLITDFTLNSICETAMGTKLDHETNEFGKSYKTAIHKLGQCVVYRAQRLWIYPDMIFKRTNIGQEFKKALHLLTTFRKTVVDKRRNDKQYKNWDLDSNQLASDDEYVSGKRRLAMLDLLLNAEENQTIDANGIGEEVDTFMFEGHDTSSSALQFAFMLLANNPKCQDIVFEECKTIFGSSNRSATMTDLAEMKYLECCIKETMRLYPPVPFIIRRIHEPLQLKDYVVPVDTDCAILIYDLHRRTDQFIEPLEFRPERFQIEPTWHPFSYIPFSAGPRNCIGQKFAMLEMKLVLSSVIREYMLLAVTKPEDLVFVTDFILRTITPIYVKFQRRK